MRHIARLNDLCEYNYIFLSLGGLILLTYSCFFFLLTVYCIIIYNNYVLKNPYYI